MLLMFRNWHVSNTREQLQRHPTAILQSLDTSELSNWTSRSPNDLEDPHGWLEAMHVQD